jgi:hypothetical protein
MDDDAGLVAAVATAAAATAAAAVKNVFCWRRSA